MKKLNKILLIGGMVMASLISFSGCNKNNDEELESIIEEALETKYAEEFECINFWGIGKNYYNGVCYPKDEPDLLFETLFYSDGRIAADYYSTALVAKKLSNEFDNSLGEYLGEHFTYCYNNGGLHDERTAAYIINGDFTLEYYFERINEVYSGNNHKFELYYDICVETSELNPNYEEEWNAIIKAIEHVREIGAQNGTELSFRINLYFVPADMYEECMKYFKNNAQIRSDFENMIEGYPEKKYNRVIKFDIKNSVPTITKNEYVELRKETN